MVLPRLPIGTPPGLILPPGVAPPPPGPPMVPVPGPMPMAGPPMGGMPPLPAPPMPSPLALAGGGMPMPMPMQQAGVDPMQMLADPQMLMLVLQLIAENEEAQNGPIYDPWFRPGDYPRPTSTAVQQKAWSDQQLYDLLVQRMAADRQILLLLNVGRWRDFNEDVEQTFTDPALVHDFMLQVNLVAGCDLNYDAKARTLDEEEIAEKKELFAHGFRDHNERRHATMYGTDLAYDEVKFYAGTGHICSRIVYDLQSRSDQCPIRMDLLDPATCYPTWDGQRGLKSMVRVYAERVDTIVATWETKKNKVKRTLLETYVGKDDKRRLASMDDTVEVIEYWDRNHNIVVANGVEVFHWEHKYGFVPFVYMRTPFGDAGPTSLHALHGTPPNMSNMTVTRAEIASKGLSVIWASKLTHTQREVLLGTLMTEINKVRNPERTFEQDMSIYGSAPQVSNAPGGITLLRKNLENEAPGPQKPGMSLIPAVMAAVNEANQRGLMPASAYGLTMNANESGTAIEGLNESGRDKISPLLKGLTKYHIACAEMALRLVRDWGHLMGSDGEKGSLYVPRLNPDPREDGYVRLEPKELRQVGIEIRCKLTSLRLQNLGNLGNALSIWKNNGWIEDIEALEMRGVRDPKATLRRIQVQELKNSDDYKRIAIMKLLEEEKDFEGMRIFREMMAKEMMAAQSGGAPGGGPPPGGPPPGLPPGLPGGPGTMGGNVPGQMQGPQGAISPGGGLGMPSRLAPPLPAPGPGQIP